MRKAFICKWILTKPDYAEPLWWSLSPPKYTPLKLSVETQQAEPLLKWGLGGGGSKETQHACIWTVHSRQPVSAATFRGGKSERWWKMPFWSINVQRLLLFNFLFVSWFSLIRTKAFSVFSEVSLCVATLWWDKTIRKRLKKRNCMNKKKTACGWPCVHSF